MQLKYLKNGLTLELDVVKCTGCGMCVAVCPHQVFQISGGKSEIINRHGCMECGACMMNCPFKAVSVRKGVGCAAAIISGTLRGTAPECGCTENNSGCCC